VKFTIYEAPHYVVFSSLLSLVHTLCKSSINGLQTLFAKVLSTVFTHSLQKFYQWFAYTLC